MTDEIIKGTGNSRYLRSSIAAGTTWESALTMLRNGTFPIDFNGKNTAGISQAGTDLNKANLLADATATAAGGSASSTVNNILANLAALYPVINNKSALAASGVAKNDKIPIADVSAGTAKTVTLTELAAALVSQLTTDANMIARIKTGSYTGTGATGQNNAIQITTGFMPKWVLIMRMHSNDASITTMFFDKLPSNYGYYIGVNNPYFALVSIQDGGFTLLPNGMTFWGMYTNSFPNKERIEYYWVALG